MKTKAAVDPLNPLAAGSLCRVFKGAEEEGGYVER